MAITKLEARGNTSSDLSLKPQSMAKKKLRVLGPGPTGPRTQRGKQKARYNAIKHGIFSEAILKGRESTAEFNSLLVGLREYFQPEGVPEELLVQKLCSTLWRQRRLLQAECAEIAKVSEFVEEDTIERQLFEGEDRDEPSFDGMLNHCDNPIILGRVIELLQELRDNLQHDGFDVKEDVNIILRIYGVSPVEEKPRGILAAYMLLEGIAKLSLEDENVKPKLTPEQAIARVIKHVDREIKRLGDLKIIVKDIESRRMQWQIKSSMVPAHDALERLLRYEASLDRSFDRTLNQLERLQRIRLCQAVAPPVQVVLSH